MAENDAENDPLNTDDQPTIPSPNPVPPVPEWIGRYRVERILGKGGFGLVYLAYDDQLSRKVAIKVPHSHLISRPEDAELYLTEARTVANLDHPNIVPVHDVGTTKDFPFFVVSKYIDGEDLAKRTEQSRLSLQESAGLVATIAEALHFSHKHGLVHRDIKPGNILLDTSKKAFVVDFGLALNEQDIGKGARFAGTPAYMSPEQARGEGHGVDGRSDVFSLGVVFYELLTGRLPFKADTQAELLEQINSVEARPPRQIDDTIPKEVERICLKALSKRASDRYTTAKDMADDLRDFFSQIPHTATGSVVSSPFIQVVQPPPTTHSTIPQTKNQPLQIVPKGLRSFDAHDADFFLELLPGAKDRDGLPDSIRFWKTQIEETDADNTFSVGVIYGPSGCGKSSLVKAGLLPRLCDDVIDVYIESTTAETETQLLNRLRKRCPTLPVNLSLTETLAALRRGQGIPMGKKVLILLDQFEQWLHAKKEDQIKSLVQALRQCDGSRVQCILMVRDDFGMAITRFMGALDIPIIQGHNFATVDLFDLLHARNVLEAFGRAHGRLPGKVGDLSKEQEAFLSKAVASLSEEGKIISVRLALFFDMVKGKTWTPDTFEVVAGAEGIGLLFLEETFTAKTAPPQHLRHKKAAQAVLKALLPEQGTDIKGKMRSYTELLEESGYTNRPTKFEELLRILNAELRLITPTQFEGQDYNGLSTDKNQVNSPPIGTRCYQLTHDYLVPSLRDWLTRKQRETEEGRAELLLEEWADLWHGKLESRPLPTLVQWINIVSFTQSSQWTERQRNMMEAAAEHHALGVCDRIFSASTTEVLSILNGIKPYRSLMEVHLRNELQKAYSQQDDRKKLHASLALLPVDPTQVDYSFGRLLEATPQDVPVICEALTQHKDALLGKLWFVVESPEKDNESPRLRAAAALVMYAPEDMRWLTLGAIIVNDLVLENLLFIGIWSEIFRPVKERMIPRLSEVFRNRQPEFATERIVATNILANYATDQSQILAELLMDANERQFNVIFPKLKELGLLGLRLLLNEIEYTHSTDAVDETKEKLAKRQANAGVALFKLGQPEKVWPLLKHSPDPRVRSYLIHRLGPLGADPKTIICRIDEETDTSIRRALLLSLGEFDEHVLSLENRTAFVSRLKELYENDADPGVHASAEWLLRKWTDGTWLKHVIQKWARDIEQRVKLDKFKQLPSASRDNKLLPQWHINSQGQTLVVIPGPVESLMGSPIGEHGRFEGEVQHIKWIGRTFAIASHSVTLSQYLEFASHEKDERFTPDLDCPADYISWFMAARYCNWLSKMEGISEDQQCYEITNGEPKLKKNYLSLTGYRLPTEAEIEYVTRAGAVTARYYGETDELLPMYAWYQRNSQEPEKEYAARACVAKQWYDGVTGELLSRYAWYQNNMQERSWPVGSLKPNDLGLFDTHGNVWNWCQESYKSYPISNGTKAVDDREDDSEIGTQKRSMRGGSFQDLGAYVRSSYRGQDLPTVHSVNVGFRLARTLSVSSVRCQSD